jgi:hypothetical protein
LSGRVDQGQAARRSLGLEALLESDCHFLGEADADETRSRHRVAVTHQRHGLGGADDLAAVAGPADAGA